MKNITKSISMDALNILLIGNNPMEMGNILDKLNSIRIKKIKTEIAFNCKTIGERLANFRPDYILIDDNIGKSELSEAVNLLYSQRKTKNTVITVLKNSNYSESFVTSKVLDYMLKQSWSAESLFIALKNTTKFRKMAKHLQPA